MCELLEASSPNVVHLPLASVLNHAIDAFEHFYKPNLVTGCVCPVATPFSDLQALDKKALNYEIALQLRHFLLYGSWSQRAAN